MSLQVDMTALKQMGENDLKELGIPMLSALLLPFLLLSLWSLHKFKICSRSLQITPFLILSPYPVSRNTTAHWQGLYLLACQTPIVQSLLGTPSLSVNKLAFGGFGYGSGSYCTGPIMPRLSLVLSRREASYNVHVQIKSCRTSTGGGCYDRYCICIEAMLQSLQMILQCPNKIPSGNWHDQS
ncbi:hypothetical protein TSUD_243300 [Trifolium subterraneum]|uniref:NADH-quinone oxidoreductase subunit D domain-containing protein n=1 Tax=Trifolium subterraneum TaxID=3900 RepID=A0A2Z6P3J4_TRISU|nr:hypothetical protein TSUD_243300 [Trifolium subterraneum]